MRVTLIIHSENENKLRNLFKKIKYKIDKSKTCIILNSKGYFPWQSPDLNSEITSFSEYSAYPTDKATSESVVEILLKTKDGDVIILNEEFDDFKIQKDVFGDQSSLYCGREDLLNLNLDTKYQTLKWFFTDIMFQKFNNGKVENDGTTDNKRFDQKIISPFFNEKIIYVDGGLGDHIMALPLLESLAKDVYVSCKFPFVFDHLPIKGVIHWNDELFGGYNRFVYQYGSANNSKTIIDAFFEIYGYKRDKNQNILKYSGKKESNPDIITDKKIALICTSAAKIQGLDSNKDWRDIRWLKLIHELKNKGYYVIQVGSKNDNQIPTVDLKFLDRPIQNLAKLIGDSSLWISVDTFFHHFASSIKPEVGVCLTPFYNDHAKHTGVTYVEKNCGKNFSDRKWWMDLQQPERKECMDLIQINDVLKVIDKI